MQPFVFNTVPQLICSQGSALQLADSCRRLRISKPLRVTDPGLIAIGLVQPVLAALDVAGFSAVLLDQVREDPPAVTVEAAAAAGA